MTEEEIFKNVWNETHHFKLTLANGEILDLIDLKFYTDLLGKYSEIKAENEKLKKEVEIKHDGFMASIDDVCEHAKENDKLRSVIDKAIHALKDMQFQYEGLGDLDVVMKILEMEDKHE